jgi:hypothetical protein
MTILSEKEAIRRWCFWGWERFMEPSQHPAKNAANVDFRINSIVIPSKVEILGSKCCRECEPILGISSKSNSQLKCIESRPFWSRRFSIVIVLTVVLIADDADSDLSGAFAVLQ